ncbi:MAG TPA: NTP transferase domain-containing protein, partial [Patescibacteria group bacterium]|nr:NTP transferase domain-containing protein [Patescibacteria group bacterium]
GGRSTRFGEDKLVAEVGGRPLLHLAIDAVATAVDEVVVVVGADAPAPCCRPASESRWSWRAFDPAGESFRDVDTARRPAVTLKSGYPRRDRPARPGTRSCP